MRPILASPDFTGFEQGMVQFYSWLIAAAFSLVALVLVFWRRTREASMLFAVGSMLFSVISGLALASFASVLHDHGESIWQAGDPIWRDMVVFFAPLIVAVVVCYLGRRTLKVDVPKLNMEEANSAKDPKP
jgi:MFS family permease